MDSRIICTKEAYLSVFYVELCRRTRILCVFIITLCASVVPGIEIYLRGKDALTLGGCVGFLVLFYLFWKVGCRALKKIADKSVNEIWSKFPCDTLWLDIKRTEPSIIFEGIDVTQAELRRTTITRIETINGYTAIFVDCGCKKDSLVFVATEDVTEELKRCLLQEEVIDAEDHFY